jgi:hypothetical protein
MKDHHIFWAKSYLFDDYSFDNLFNLSPHVSEDFEKFANESFHVGRQATGTYLEV